MILTVRWRSTRLYYDAVVKTLYCRSYDSILLRCLSSLEAQEVLKEAHNGICGAHHSGPKLKDRLHRFDYDWPTMIADAIKYVRRCKACQIHTDCILQPSKLLHPIVSSWPFEAWGIDVVESISLSSAKGHQFILVIIDYFSKWVKVAPLAEVKITNVVNFIKHYVIHRLVSPDGSSKTMVPNLQANHSFGSGTSIRFKTWLQLFTTLSPTG